MFGKTSNRWLIAVVTVSVLAFAVPQTAAAAPFEAEPAGTSLSQLVQWAAELWSGLGSVFDASSTTTTTGTGGGTSQPGTGTGTNSGEQGGMIDPNG